jgi:hypothetical protein
MRKIYKTHSPQFLSNQCGGTLSGLSYKVIPLLFVNA